MTFAAAGTLASNNAAALTTLAHTNNAAGNCLVLAVMLSSLTITVSGISGGGATGWQRIAAPNNDGGRSQEMWMGTVTATGAQTITAAFSASTAGLATDLKAQEFSSSLGTLARWTADTSGWRTGAASTTQVYPTLAPRLASPELYVTQARLAASGTHSGLTAGFTEQLDTNGNPYIYGLAVTGPVTPQETTANSVVIACQAALISDTSPPARLLAARTPATALAPGPRRAVYT